MTRSNRSSERDPAQDASRRASEARDARSPQPRTTSRRPHRAAGRRRGGRSPSADRAGRSSPGPAHRRWGRSRPGQQIGPAGRLAGGSAGPGRRRQVGVRGRDPDGRVQAVEAPEVACPSPAASRRVRTPAQGPATRGVARADGVHEVRRSIPARAGRPRPRRRRSRRRRGEAQVAQLPVIGRAAVVLTIHNLAYHGWTPRESLRDLGLAPGDGVIAEDAVGVDLLWAGIERSDLVNTVSPGYARESLGPSWGSGSTRRCGRRATATWGSSTGSTRPSGTRRRTPTWRRRTPPAISPAKRPAGPICWAGSASIRPTIRRSWG